MRVTVVFDVKNFVEVLESWPIVDGDTTLFLEKEKNTVKKICIVFANVDIKNAPKITPPSDGEITSISIQGGAYANLAIQLLLNWQAILTGLQVFDIDFDNYELRFGAENIDEEKEVQISSFKSGSNDKLNSECDFEQIGRAFLAGMIPESRIESTSHYREGRIALEAGRNIDAYNNFYLFLETRYCDGKTKTAQQVYLLLDTPMFLNSLNESIQRSKNRKMAQSKHLEDIFNSSLDDKAKINTLVKLRGLLRHHSLKSPKRWDPNKQREYEEAARFLGSVVSNIVIQESIDDIYSPDALKRFRDVSIEQGFETKIKILTRRLEEKRSLALEISCPTTVISTKNCMSLVQTAMEMCESDKQLADTVKFDAAHVQNGLELFSAELGVWAFTQTRSIEFDDTKGNVVCKFEHVQSGRVIKHEFTFPMNSSAMTIRYAWELLRFSLKWIEEKDVTTRVVSLKLYPNDSEREFLCYRVGAQVKH